MRALFPTFIRSLAGFAQVAALLGVVVGTTDAAAASNTGEYRLPLSGIRSLTALSLSSTALNLGTGLTGSVLGTQTATVTNQSKSSIGPLTATVTPPFAVTSNTCLSGVTSGGTCSVSVKLNTTAAGQYSGTLTLTPTAGASVQTLNLSLSARLASAQVLYAGKYLVDGTNVTYTYSVQSGATDYTTAYSAYDAARKYLTTANGIGACATGNYQSSFDQSPSGGADVAMVMYGYQSGTSGACNWSKEYRARVYFYP